MVFTLTPDCTAVDVIGLSSQPSFRKRIAPEYCYHLKWIQEEATDHSPSGMWLWNILDCFAEELCPLPDKICLSWRSAALNPLLMRAFYHIPHHEPDAIQTKVSAMLSRSSLRVRDWQVFYLGLDVIFSCYSDSWALVKPKRMETNIGDLAEGSPVENITQPEPLKGGPGTATAHKMLPLFPTAHCIFPALERVKEGQRSKLQGGAIIAAPFQVSLLVQDELLSEEGSSTQEQRKSSNPASCLSQVLTLPANQNLEAIVEPPGDWWPPSFK